MRAVTACAVALAVLGAALLPGAASQGEAPGCREEAPGVYVCAWKTPIGPTSGTFHGALPQLGQATFDFRVSTPYELARYNLSIVRVRDQADIWHWRSTRGAASFSVFLELDPAEAHEVRLSPREAALWSATGEIDVSVAIREARGSIAAGISAGGPDDPHLSDSRGDSDRPEDDIRGVWFDDPILDDGLLEIGMRLENLEALAVAEHEQRRYTMTWRVLDSVYEASFIFRAEFVAKDFGQVGQAGWDLYVFRVGTTGVASQFGDPIPDLANGTLRARIPIAWIGDPPDEARFSEMAASVETCVYYNDFLYALGLNPATPSTCVPHDDARGDARPFALGGPEVWAKLRGEEPLVPASVPAPWYADPLAAENLPNTLQVLAAAAAVVTFLAGLLVVRRRRERLARLLDDVDAVLDTHRDDPRRAVEELDALERRFDRMQREGHLAQGDHATLLGRVERAGYRLVRAVHGAADDVTAASGESAHPKPF